MRFAMEAIDDEAAQSRPRRVFSIRFVLMSPFRSITRLERLIDVKFGIIVDVESSPAICQAEVGAAKTMIERAKERFDLKPQYLAADTAHGSAETLDWVVNEKR
jgi:hypothetical protein